MSSSVVPGIFFIKNIVNLKNCLSKVDNSLETVDKVEVTVDKAEKFG
jgi:hypothetical protein